MKTKHTPEPWVADTDGLIVHGVYVKSNGAIIGCVPLSEPDRQIAWAKQQVNSARICACVNACAGMADPEKEIADLKRQADLWLNHVASHDNLP